jgi:DNA-binding CsgD family transcriptional regulator
MCLNQDAMKKYTMRVFQKLGVSSRAELLALANAPPGSSPHWGGR